MTDRLASLVAHARNVPSERRASLAGGLRLDPPPGTVLLETCHRVEVLGAPSGVGRAAERLGDARGHLLDEAATVRHVARLAVGLESAVVGEDQILHQLRTAVREARGRGPLEPALDRLLDLSLRAGRRARTWLPGHRPTLADVALDRALGPAAVGSAAARPTVLIVGAGAMGRLAADAARRRGHDVLVASRTPARAQRLAASVGGSAIPLDADPEVLASVDAVVVALSGPWPLGPDGRAAITARRTSVVDLSAPPAVPADLAGALGPRHVSIDDLAAGPPSPDVTLLERLDRLVDETVAAFDAWLAADAERSLARALVDRATDARAAELSALWQRLPSLDGSARAEIERMAAQLTERLLRDPLERLGDDADGRRTRAAQELFRL